MVLHSKFHIPLEGR